MEQWERELHVARIINGKTRIRVDGTTLYVVTPTREQRLAAAEVYGESRRDAELAGALSDDELLSILITHRIWTPKDAEETKSLTKALEDLKVSLFENRLRSNAKFTIRGALRKTRDELLRLESLRHSLDYVTVNGLAMSAKYRYLIGVTIYYEDGNPYWKDGSWDHADPFIDKVMETISSQSLDEKQFRELARNDPWQSIWWSKSHSGRGIFDCPATELNDDQKSLILWSSIYDSIRDHPEAPNDDIMSDDDMLDGWRIIQRRKREGQLASQEANRIGNAKIRDADEQFIFVDNINDAREVDKMNDPFAVATKQKRMAVLREKGEVNEVNMPDTAQRIQMELSRLEQMKMRQIRQGK